MNVYWSRCAGNRNLGDQLGPLLLDHYRPGIDLTWTAGPDAELVACGSVIDAVPDGWGGTVLNAGTLRATTRRRLTGDVLSLRGMRTARAVGARDGVLLGDLGVLAPRLLAERPTVEYDTVVLPHYADRDLADRWPDAHLVRITADPVAVIGEVAASRRVVTSSLHGMVVADAFGIPTRWEPCEKVAGGAHKFDDYLTAFGEGPVEAHQWRLTPRPEMERVQTRLDAMMRAYASNV